MATIFDLEGDGFLENITQVHCLVLKDTVTGVVTHYDALTPGQGIEVGLRHLLECDEIVPHNGIKYDIPVLQKFWPWWKPDPRKVFDTLVASRLIHTDLRDTDGALVEKNKPAVFADRVVGEDPFGNDIIESVEVKPAVVRFPSKLFGSHSLKAWGYRLGILKGEFQAENGGDDAFKVYTPEMLEYCKQDVEVTAVLYAKLKGCGYSERALAFEHQVAWYCAMMERSGWPFDEAGAAALYAVLVSKREAIRVEMLKTFEPLVIERVSEKTGKKLKPKVIEFNPGSRLQIAERLSMKYGWKPKEFTSAGKPKVDEEVLKKLKYPEAQILAEYFLLEKRIGQIAEGEQAWLKNIRDGRIHGSINTNGAVTGRCTHQAPNLAQVPGARSPYGKECRSLFHVPQGFSQVGADLSGLELRCLAHFMAVWDGGEYANEVLNGDVHTKNQLAAGLPTRDNAKTFIYGFLYGAGDEKIGSIVGKGRSEGKRLKEKFLKSTPALKKLREKVTERAKRGHLIGLDGRLLHVRSAHAALNTLLQSAGALISKQWLVQCFLDAEAAGLKYGWDGDFVMLGYIHDEIQWAVRSEKAQAFGEMVIAAAAKAGVHFNFRCPIGAEFKLGQNWYDCH